MKTEERVSDRAEVVSALLTGEESGEERGGETETVSLAGGGRMVRSGGCAKMVVPANVSVNISVTVTVEGRARLVLGGGASMVLLSALSAMAAPIYFTAGKNMAITRPAIVPTARLTMATSMAAVVAGGLLVREGRSALSLRCVLSLVVVLRLCCDRRQTREKVVVRRYALCRCRVCRGERSGGGEVALFVWEICVRARDSEGSSTEWPAFAVISECARGGPVTKWAGLGKVGR